MSTMTIRVTASAVNQAGTGFGSQPDLGAPSFYDVIITDSTDPALPDGTYDGYCLHPELLINFSPTEYAAEGSDGGNGADYIAAGVATITDFQIDQINWLLAQNFTTDPKYAGQFNFGEVQSAIYEILGYTPDQYNIGITPEIMTDNGRQTVERSDIDFLVVQSQIAIASGINVVPTDTYFSALIDPEGNAQPLIIQLQSAKIGNFVWQDSNNNGIQDVGELGVNSVVVELYDDIGRLIATTKTGDDHSTAEVETGFYEFTGLKAGNYQVKFIPPATMALTVKDANSNTQDALDSDAEPSTGLSHVISLAVGESNQTIDAGLVGQSIEQARLGDRVFEDSNANGIQDDNESGIANVTVNLKDANGNVIDTTITDVNGNYSFSVDPGTYSVAIVTPDGYIVTDPNQGNDDAKDSDIDPATNMSGNYTLTEGETNLTADAGLYKLAELGDRVWLDANKNGVQDAGEAGLAGVKVTLLDSNGAAVGSPLVTDANGNYLFTNLRPGVYSVQFDAATLPAGHSFTIQDQGDDTADSDANPVDGKTIQTTLTSGESDRTWDAGIVAPERAALGDYVWFDEDGNGRQDDGKTGMNGVTVNLLDSNGNQVATTMTANDANGNSGYYLFDNLMPGDYQVQFVSPAGFQFTTQDQGDDIGDSDADTATGLTVTTTLEAGENDLSWDAGLIICTAKLGDLVWLDTNKNGVQDDGETGVPDVTVTLVDAGADGQLNTADDIQITTTTDANGNYLFEEIENGKYQLLFDVPDNLNITVPNAGDNDAKDSDVMPARGLKSVGLTAISSTAVWTSQGGGYIEDSLDDVFAYDPDDPTGQMPTIVWGSTDGTTGYHSHVANGQDAHAVYGLDNTYIVGSSNDSFVIDFYGRKGFGYRDNNFDVKVSDADGNTIGVVTGLDIPNTEKPHLRVDLVSELELTGGQTIGSFEVIGHDSADSNANNFTLMEVRAAATSPLEPVRLTAISSSAVWTSQGGRYIEDSLDDAFAYDPGNPTGQMPTTVWGSTDGTTGFHSNIANGQDAHAVYGLENKYTVGSTADSFVVDFYGRKGFGYRDNNFDVKVSDADGNTLGVVTGLDIPNTEKPHLRVDLVSELELTGGQTIGSFEVIGHDSADSNGNYFTLMEVRAAAANSSSTAKTDIITVDNWQDDLTIDAGLVTKPAEKASIGNFVWEDKNFNGIQDPDEPGVAGVKISLYAINSNGQYV